MDNNNNGSSNNSSSSNSREMMYLKQVNKNSHKISKPTANNAVTRKPLPPMVPVPDPNQVPALALAQPQSQQPPVYNINKNDFRDVVQKLTGSPAHDRFTNPSPGPSPNPPLTTHPRPPSSRLQRIRPPPLNQITNRPPPQFTQSLTLNPRQNDSVPQQQQQNFPPLPPLPSVHAAAESPISAYMRYLHAADPTTPAVESPVTAYMRLLQSSIANSTSTAPPPPSSPFPALPMSPLPFGCVPSPRSSFLLSPTGMPQLPLSPTVPVPSPRWKSI